MRLYEASEVKKGGVPKTAPLSLPACGVVLGCALRRDDLAVGVRRALRQRL